MDKGKTFVGQPILAQIISCIPKNEVGLIAKAHQSDRYYKKIPLQTHLITLLYGILSCCNGLREICEGMLVCEGKLNHLGLQKAPARSTLSDANNNRHWTAFESIYYMLLKRYHSFLSDSRLKGLRIKNLKIIDSTTLRLFSCMNALVKENIVTPSEVGHREWVWSAFTGLKQEYRITGFLKGNAQAMYNLFDPNYKSPYGDRLNVRVGFEFVLKKKVKEKNNRQPAKD